MDFLIELIKKDPSEVGGARESNEETIMFALNMIHTGEGGGGGTGRKGGGGGISVLIIKAPSL